MEKNLRAERGRQPYIYLDGIKFYKERSGNGYYLSGRISSNAPIRLHNYVWIKYFGDIPKGYHVHHKDRNVENNDISNLELKMAATHLSDHGKEEWRKDKLRENMLKYVIPAAAKWHSSKEGIEWHKKHYEAVRDKLHKPINRRCAHCGKEYWTHKAGHLYCSNNCKSAARKMSGVDNIYVKCLACDNEFGTNKYSRAKYCSKECRVNYAKSKDG